MRPYVTELLRSTTLVNLKTSHFKNWSNLPPFSLSLLSLEILFSLIITNLWSNYYYFRRLFKSDNGSNQKHVSSVLEYFLLILTLILKGEVLVNKPLKTWDHIKNNSKSFIINQGLNYRAPVVTRKDMRWRKAGRKYGVMILGFKWN